MTRAGVHRAEFGIALPREKLLRHYRGEAHGVVVITADGTTLQLPASALRPFVDHTGIHGRFQVEYDRRGKLLSLRRLR